jgi:hypothetical protein
MSGSPVEKPCPNCGSQVPVAANFCLTCGWQFSFGPSRAIAAPPPAPRETFTRLSAPPPHGVEQTITGLAFLIASFLLAWIPYVSLLGDILAIIGVIFLWLGREDLVEPHPLNVVAGTILLVLSFIITLAVALWFVGAIDAAATTPFESPAQLASVFDGYLQGFFEGVLVAAILALLANLLFVYALADSASRALLWGAFVVQLAIAITLVSVALGEIPQAVQQATNSSTPNLAPLQAVQASFQLLSLAYVIPSLLFAYAYYRVRERLKDGEYPRKRLIL